MMMLMTLIINQLTINQLSNVHIFCNYLFCNKTFLSVHYVDFEPIILNTTIFWGEDVKVAEKGSII